MNKAHITDAGPFEKVVSFEISAGELNHALNRASRRISREVNIPGFRPGRAPRRLVERRVGADQVRSEALDELVPARVEGILSETEIAPVVPPLLESVTDTLTGAVKVEVRVTTWPRLESPPDLEGRVIQVREERLPVSEEVDARIERLRYMYAPLETVERAVQRGDFVVMDLTAVEEGEPVEALSMDDLHYEVGSNNLPPEVDHSLLGRSAGEEFEFDAPLPDYVISDSEDEDDYWEDEEASADDADPEDVMGMYRVRLASVHSRSLPPLDDDWASEYSGHDSLEDLRREMTSEVEEGRNAERWELLVAETIKEAVSDSELELPERLESAQTEMLLRRHLASLASVKLDYPTYLESAGLDHETFIGVLRERAVAGLKARILVESVIDAEGLVVEDAEVIEAMNAIAREARDPERSQREDDGGVNAEHVRSDMLISRAQALLAMQVQPVDDRGEPLPIEAPAHVKAWFGPAAEPAEIPDPGGDLEEALYEAEVIDDPYPA